MMSQASKNFYELAKKKSLARQKQDLDHVFTVACYTRVNL